MLKIVCIFNNNSERIFVEREHVCDQVSCSDFSHIDYGTTSLWPNLLIDRNVNFSAWLRTARSPYTCNRILFVVTQNHANTLHQLVRTPYSENYVLRSLQEV